MLGSYDSYNLEPSDGLINNLTDEQKQNYSRTLKKYDSRAKKKAYNLAQNTRHPAFAASRKPSKAAPSSRRRNGSMRSWPASKS